MRLPRPFVLQTILPVLCLSFGGYSLPGQSIAGQSAADSNQDVRTGRPKFEVTSVKPNNVKDSPVSMGFAPGSGHFGARNATLRMLIGLIYKLQDYQIVGGPDWINSERFDIDAEAHTDTGFESPDRMLLMAQSLLSDRFELKTHKETKESAVYALVVAKDGLKIKPSADQTAPSGPTQVFTDLPAHGAIRGGAGSLVGNAVPLSLFAAALSQQSDRLVVDETGLTGRFDIELHWTPDLAVSGTAEPGASSSQDSSLPGIFTAIQEQLGLKLESARAPVDVLVIDHVEEPTPN